jgi:hypothetical protein
MKRLINSFLIKIVFLIFLCPCSFCDSSEFQQYKQNFSKAGLSEKAEILKYASRDRSAEEFIGQFFEYALQFALDNSGLLKDDTDMVNLVSIAVLGLRNTGTGDSLNTLWNLFQEYPDSAIGAEILVTMGKLGKGNRYVIDNFNDYLAGQNMLFYSGNSVNYMMISACIAAIVELGDSSSYQVLFSVLCSDYPEVIAFEASGAFDLIPGNLKQFLFNVIERNPPAEKFLAFKAGISSERLSLSERGQLAELALEQSLVSPIDEDNADLTALRYSAVTALTRLRWTRANALAIRHYYRVQTDFQHNTAGKNRFLEAIACLGAVGNSDAALALVLQLGLINARMEKAKTFDPEITLAIVRALGLIGDKAAFDQLLDVRNLPYPENIKAAAKESIDRLKW